MAVDSIIANPTNSVRVIVFDSSGCCAIETRAWDAGRFDATVVGGISEALVTTFFGLVVAIPALVLHSLLSRRSQGIVQTTEKLSLRIVNSIRKNSNEGKGN